MIKYRQLAREIIGQWRTESKKTRPARWVQELAELAKEALEIDLTSVRDTYAWEMMHKHLAEYGKELDQAISLDSKKRADDRQHAIALLMTDLQFVNKDDPRKQDNPC